jgi:chemotaxis protein methyltransferase CheR
MDDLGAYQRFLENEPAEWCALDRLCRVTISRFFRDRGLWLALEQKILPRLAEGALRRGATVLEAWCAGCASGEEPYSLAILWRQRLARRFPDLTLTVLATDIDLTVLARARRGTYAPGSLRESRPLGLEAAFDQVDDETFHLRRSFRGAVRFAALDLKGAAPEGKFDLVFCRNLAFTYYQIELQRRIVETIRSRLEPGGVLIIGSHEVLPDGVEHHALDPQGIVAFEDPPLASS